MIDDYSYIYKLFKMHVISCYTIAYLMVINTKQIELIRLQKYDVLKPRIIVLSYYLFVYYWLLKV